MIRKSVNQYHFNFCTQNTMKIAVIGAGISGLLSTKYSKGLGLDVTCFEKSNESGGIWVYTENTGFDKHGLKVHSAQYKNLKTNVANPLMGFQDFPFKGSDESSFTTGNEMYKFLRNYKEKFQLEENIKLEHLVEFVKPLGDQWRVKVRDLKEKRTYEEIFDAVFVCTGHYSTPCIPEIKGIDNFKGEVLHSHSYRRPEAFEGKTVLIMGAGPSGIDLVLDTSSHAKNVIFSHHKKQFVGYPKNVTQKPDISEILPGGRVQFQDGSQEDIDAIIFCTGYLYNFPFLDDSCGIEVDNNHVKPLFKHVVNINHPTMFFVGLPFISINSFTMEVQVRFALYFLLMKPENRPKKSEMLKDYENYVEEARMKGKRKKDMHCIGVDGIMKYFKELTDFAQLEPLQKVYADMYKTGYARLVSEPLTFRRYKYSVVDSETFKDEFK